MSRPENRLGIEMLSGMRVGPIELVTLAADLGCAHISTGLWQMPPQYNPMNHPHWSLKDDVALRREMKAVMADRGVSVSLGEGFAAMPGVSMKDRAAEMDIMAELGARGLGAVGREPDEARQLDELAMLAEMAGQRGMLATLEFAPIQEIATLPQALAAHAAVNSPNLKLNIDAMHLFRSGGTVADVAALDPAIIGYAQLCDGPMIGVDESYLEEAMNGRLPLGEGAFPLAELVKVLPKNIPIGLEIPMLAAAQAGVSGVDRLRSSVAAARAMLEGD